jgi:hypothetical protein
MASTFPHQDVARMSFAQAISASVDSTSSRITKRLEHLLEQLALLRRPQTHIKNSRRQTAQVK